MATRRVLNTGDNTDGSTWAKAYTTLAAAMAASTGDFDIILVDAAHVESAATQTLNVPTAGNHLSIISVNKSGTTDHSGWAAMTGSIGVSANSTALNVANSGGQYLFCSGLRLNGNNGNGSTNQVNIGTVVTAVSQVIMLDCVFDCQGSSTSTYIAVGGATASNVFSPRITLINPEFKVRNAAGSSVPAIYIRQGKIEIFNPTVSFSGGTKPLLLFGFAATTAAIDCMIQDGSIAGYNASGGTLISVAGWGGGRVTLKNLRYDSTPAFITGTWASNSAELFVINCDTGDTKTVFEYRNRLGTIIEDETNYANDGSGCQIKGTNVAWRIDLTSACNEMEPFRTPWIKRPTSLTSSQTLTIEMAQATGATSLTDKTAWQEAQYVSSSSYPSGSLASNRVATPFDTGTGSTAASTLSTSSIAWAGLSSPVKQYSSQAVTPGEACDLEVRMCFGISTTPTIYMDPVIRVS